MDITGIEYKLFRNMRDQNVVPLEGDLLQLGEAKWHGDVPIQSLGQDIYRYAEEDSRKDLFERLSGIVEVKRPGILFEIADVYWQTFLQPRSKTAIDFHGTETALKLDLNDPINLGRQFHVVMNLGTAEHVFNTAQVFKTIHDHTLPEGLMIHGLPFTGWIDHGFYSFNPTFYWDIAAANNYKIMAMVYAELKPLKLVQIQGREQLLDMVKGFQTGQNSLIYAVMRQPLEITAFQIPIQGYYSGSILREASVAWKPLC